MHRYEVIRDTREQTGWWFRETDKCFGTTEETLKTGDYTIRGFEDRFVIERKGCSGEFAQNILQDRFERELERLEEFQWPFLILEFSMSDIMQYPKNSGLPYYVQKKSKISPSLILSRLLDYQLKYKTKIILAGSAGEEIATRLFLKLLKKAQKE